MMKRNQKYLKQRIEKPCSLTYEREKNNYDFYTMILRSAPGLLWLTITQEDS